MEEVPTPERLLIMAKAYSPKTIDYTKNPPKRTPSLVDYGAVIFTLLYEKHMWCAEVAKWFRERGVTGRGKGPTKQSIRGAFKSWLKREGYASVEVGEDHKWYLRKAEKGQ